MIFDYGTDVFESEKERNLCYKVFAGYLLNEHIEGLEARLDTFCEWINRSANRGKAAPETNLNLDVRTTHVSFDNHAYLFPECSVDGGEFADILIHDRSTKAVVTIEAKVHTNWDHEKDIVENGERIRRIEARMAGVTFVPCLLTTKAKWEGARRKRNHPGSNYRRFLEMEDNRFRVLFWEELSTLVESQDVKALIQTVLDHPPGDAAYRFNEGWFLRERG